MGQFRSLLISAAMAGLAAPCPAQSVTYAFTGSDLSPTLSQMPPGVTASAFSIGTFNLPDLTDNGGSGNALRISRDDIGTSSGTALNTTGAFLSFSITIPAGTVLDLNSLTLDFTSGGLAGTEFMNCRVFSSIDGHDQVTEDTVGVLGRNSNGATSGTSTISLTTPDSNATNGTNSNNGDFSGLTAQTITFSLPFIRDAATTATDYIEIDNIRLAFSLSTVVPAATPKIIMPLGDSITQGAGALGGYRAPLLTLLDQSSFPFRFVGTRTDGPTAALTSADQAHHEGHGSYATNLLTGNLDGLLAPVPVTYGTPPNTNEGGYWLTGVSGRPPVFPDIILLMIGTNDMGMFDRSAAETYALYDELLTKLVTLRPLATIICSTVLPYNGDPLPPGKDYSQREAKNLAFSKLLPALVAAYQANGHRVRLVDMRQKINPANASTMLTSDGVHPNQSGYNAIAQGWYEAILQVPMLESWRARYFGSALANGDAADLADPDQDGHSNLEEYVFGTNPTASEPAHPVTQSVNHEGGNDYLSITFTRRKHSDVTCVAEVSSALDSDSWSSATVQSGTPLSLNADFEQVTFRDSLPTTSNTHRFIRVSILHP